MDERRASERTDKRTKGSREAVIWPLKLAYHGHRLEVEVVEERTVTLEPQLDVVRVPIQVLRELDVFFRTMCSYTHTVLYYDSFFAFFPPLYIQIKRERISYNFPFQNWEKEQKRMTKMSTFIRSKLLIDSLVDLLYLRTFLYQYHSEIKFLLHLNYNLTNKVYFKLPPHQSIIYRFPFATCVIFV